jgi:hypothetical protein
MKALIVSVILVACVARFSFAQQRVPDAYFLDDVGSVRPTEQGQSIPVYDNGMILQSDFFHSDTRMVFQLSKQQLFCDPKIYAPFQKNFGGFPNNIMTIPPSSLLPRFDIPELVITPSIKGSFILDPKQKFDFYLGH